MPSHKKIEYVIFDMDGLMIDSERIYTDVTNDILAPYGAEMTWEIKAGLMGKPDRASAAHLLSFFPDIPLSIDEYLALRVPAQKLRWPHVQLLPGVERLVAHLARHAVPIAIATGSTRRNFELKTAHLQRVFAHFGSNVVCADDGDDRDRASRRRGKPFPDVFLAAARMLGRDIGLEDKEVGDDGVGEAQRQERAQGLVLEDAIPGVEAGKRAGMNVVWVPDENLRSVGTWPVMEEQDQVLHSLEAFIPEQWGLPPFDDVPVSHQHGAE